jgi:hypothetical protein
MVDGSIVLDSTRAHMRMRVLQLCAAPGGASPTHEFVPQNMDAPFTYAAGEIRIATGESTPLLLAFDSASSAIRWAATGSTFLKNATGSASSRGTYGLVTVNNQALPFKLADARGCTRSITSGGVTLAADGMFEVSTTLREHCSGASGVAIDHYNGRYEPVHGGILFMPTEGRAPFAVATRADELAFSTGGLAMRFVPGASTSDVAEPQALPAYMTGNAAGTCNAATAFPALHATAARDTAGIGARVRSHFPGWHVSREAEMGCLAQQDSFDPVSFYSGWDSGRAWWVQRADFNADTRPDVVTFITRDADASSMKIVALHGAGGGYEVTDVNQAVVMSIVPAGTLMRGCAPESARGRTPPPYRLRTPAISVSNDMNWTAHFLWSGGRYRTVNSVAGFADCD